MGRRAQKKSCNYRLSQAALERLKAVSRDVRLSKTEVIERLVERYLDELAEIESQKVAETAAKYGRNSKPPAGSDASGR
jgi:predicted DNA-binding protein